MSYALAVVAYIAELHAQGLTLARGDVIDVGHADSCGLFTAAVPTCTCTPSISLRRGLSVDETIEALRVGIRQICAQRHARQN